MSIPRHGATFDEFAWTWLGINILTKGEPISWSSQPQYTNRFHLLYQGAAFWIVKPYLEHPPLFGLIAGGFAIARGARSMYDVTLHQIRPLALLMGTSTILLIMVYAYMLYGFPVAIVSGLIYAVSPTTVIGSRIVQNENFLIPLWITSLLLLRLYISKKKSYYYYISVGIASILPLAKVPWVVVPISVAMILSYFGYWKKAIITGIVSLLVFCTYIFYGLFLDNELFIKLWTLQLARYDIHFHGVFSIITRPLLVDRYYIDGWVFASWLSLACLFCRTLKKYIFIIVPIVSYMLIYIVGIPDEPAHGWYRYPFLPFLILSLGIMFVEEYRHMTVYSLLSILIIGLAVLGNSAEVAFGFSYVQYRIFILTVAVSVLVPVWFKKEITYSRYVVPTWLLLLSCMSIWSIIMYIE